MPKQRMFNTVFDATIYMVLFIASNVFSIVIELQHNTQSLYTILLVAAFTIVYEHISTAREKSLAPVLYTEIYLVIFSMAALFLACLYKFMNSTAYVKNYTGVDVFISCFVCIPTITVIIEWFKSLFHDIKARVVPKKENTINKNKVNKTPPQKNATGCNINLAIVARHI